MSGFGLAPPTHSRGERTGAPVPIPRPGGLPTTGSTKRPPSHPASARGAAHNTSSDDDPARPIARMSVAGPPDPHLSSVSAPIRHREGPNPYSLPPGPFRGAAARMRATVPCPIHARGHWGGWRITYLALPNPESSARPVRMHGA